MYKWCKTCDAMKQYSHKLHMIIEKKKKEEFEQMMKGDDLKYV